MANVPAIIGFIVAGILLVLLIVGIVLWLLVLSPGDISKAKTDQIAECKTLVPLGATGVPTATVASGTVAVTWTAPTVDATKVTSYRVILTPSTVTAVPGPTGFDTAWKSAEVSGALTVSIPSVTAGTYKAWVAPVGKCGAFGPFTPSANIVVA